MNVDNLSHVTTSEPNQENVRYIEMEQNPVFTIPSVYLKPTVITAQPQEERESRERRSMNTLDWTSTSNLQITTVFGSYVLNDLEQLEIRQIVDLSTLFGKKRKFNYKVKIPRAETVFLALDLGQTEESSCWDCANLFRDEFTLNVVNRYGEKAFTMIMKSRLAYMVSRLHVIKVLGPNLIGTVEQNYRLLGVCFTIYNAEKEELCYIEGPNICSCCMYPELHFKVMSADGRRQIASFMHLWDSILREYILLLTFSKELDTSLKSLLLAASFLIEYVYFKDEASSEGPSLFPAM
ncbi:phospholipid scramblase 2-like isoform X2 [Frieseomelitta varia]|uniref:phospholipid scramblase 2-like isoform X2 n=1 Tax=Frieseomelitta varia TaxID=561572 RepID=UPI001CB6AE1A|nr:phospholipid scramblase 2-like isoform X2 [Frieseomelitta varia]